MTQFMIYLNEDIEKKVKELKQIVKVSKADIVQRVLQESFKESIDTLMQIFKEKEEETQDGLSTNIEA